MLSLLYFEGENGWWSGVKVLGILQLPNIIKTSITITKTHGTLPDISWTLS